MYLETLKIIFSWKSLFDISLVAILFYQIISMLKGTRAAQVLIGMLVIFIAYVFSNVLQFETLHWIISKFYSSFIIVVIVLFQDDIRRLLSRFGRGPFFSGIDMRSGANIIEEVINAARSLSHERIGALIVFERSIGLDKLYDHSVRLDAFVSEQLLGSVFQSFSPLHDGAVIIQKNRITCASAQLPLSKNPRFSKKLGTRHSAAVGISEETDSVVLVVSEETGNISIAWEGNLQKQNTPEAAKKMLYVLLLPRGDRNAVVEWFEDKVLFNYNKFVVNLKAKLGLHKKNPNLEFDRRTHFDRRSQDAKYYSEAQAMRQIEQENKMAAQSKNHVYVRFPRGAKIKEIELDRNLVMSGIPQTTADILSQNQNHGIDVDENISRDTEDSNNVRAFGKNEALRAITELAPEDRFDPPIPKSSPPRDVSIGGVSLNPPIDIENDENKEDKK